MRDPNKKTPFGNAPSSTREEGRKLFTKEEFSFKFDAPGMIAPLFGQHTTVTGAKLYVRKMLSEYAPVTIYTQNDLDDPDRWLSHSTLTEEGVWETHEHIMKP